MSAAAAPYSMMPQISQTSSPCSNPLYKPAAVAGIAPIRGIRRISQEADHVPPSTRSRSSGHSGGIVDVFASSNSAQTILSLNAAGTEVAGGTGAMDKAMADCTEDASLTLVATQPLSDAIVLPACPSFPSNSSPLSLHPARRAFSGLPFNIKRGARRPSEPAPTHTQPPPTTSQSTVLSGTLPTPTDQSHKCTAKPSRHVVSFKNYKQFLFHRTSEIQAAAPKQDPSDHTPPPLDESPSQHPPPITLTPEVPLQELACIDVSTHHSQRPSGYNKDELQESPAEEEAEMAPAPSSQPNPQLPDMSSFMYTGSAMTAYDSLGSTIHPSSSGVVTPGSSGREWRPRSLRNLNKVSLGAASRPGSHRYTYGNVYMYERSETQAGQRRLQRPVSEGPPVRPRMIRPSSHVSIISSMGTPLELERDSSFTMNETEDKQQRGYFSKLAPYDVTNTRSSARTEAPRSLGRGSTSLPQSRMMQAEGLKGMTKSASVGRMQEWRPRSERAKAKLELGGLRTEGSSFAYSFMYGIGSEHEATMQQALRSNRELRETLREQRRLVMASTARRSPGPVSELEHTRSKAAARALHDVSVGLDGGSHRPAARSSGSSSDGSDASGSGTSSSRGDGEDDMAEMEYARLVDEALDDETAALDPQGHVDCGGYQLPVGPRFKQYKFPISRRFKFSDGTAVSVPFERRL